MIPRLDSGKNVSLHTNIKIAMSNTAKGVVWSGIERLSVQGISFLLSIIIARFVTPNEYGLIAMLAIFMAISQSFIDSGFGNALIQKKDRNDSDFSTVFYFNVAIAVLLYGVLYFCAPLIAKFYNQPELLLITRYVGLNLIFISVSTVPRTRLNIELNFKLQAKVFSGTVIISGIVGIVMAYKGHGVWALVVQGLLNNLLSTIFIWIVAKWRPILDFSIDSFKRLFSFGSKLLISGLLHTIYLNFYNLVIGKLYNAADAGFYSRAYSISQYPSTNIVMIISRAIYPVQCEHQDDVALLENMFVVYLRMSCYIVFPLMMLLAIIAEPLVSIVLTEKWLPAAPLISILSIAYMWTPVMVINNQMLNVKGRSDLFLRAEIIKKIVAIGVLCATLPYGLIWLCLGAVLYSLADIVIIIHFVKKIINIGYTCQLKALWLITVLTFGCGALSYLSMTLVDNDFSKILIAFVCFLLTFVGMSAVLKLDEIKQLKQILHI